MITADTYEDSMSCIKDSDTNNPSKNGNNDVTREKPLLRSDEGFSKLSNLEEDYLIHRNEKSYSSKAYNKSFPEKTSLISCDTNEDSLLFINDPVVNSSEMEVLNQAREKPFLCRVCHESFSQLSDLKEHYLAHTNKESYSSNVCNQSVNENISFDSSDASVDFERQEEDSNIHEKDSDCSGTPDIDLTHDKSFLCSICNENFSLLCDLEKHYLAHSNEKSDLSHKSFIDKTSLVSSAINQDLTLGKKNSEATNSSKTRDINLSQEKSFLCSICDKSFALQSDLNEHCSVHTNEESNSSIVRDNNFKEKTSLTRQRFSRSTRKLYSCNICDESFHAVKPLKAHIRKFHADSLEPKGIFTCTICKTSFLCKVSLNRHMFVHTNPDDKPHACSECGKSFSFKSSLDKHQIVHSKEKAFTCSLCNKAFARKCEIRQHHITHHSEERPHSCSLCNKTFKRKSYLTSHYRTHTNEKPFECTMCAKTFGQKSHLRVHLLSHDVNRPKPHICDVCGKKFTVRTQLKNHYLKHTGERPHTCPICNKTFRIKADLNRHCLTHSTEKNFQCDFCQKKFALRAQLLNHSLIHYDEKLYSCDICGKKFKRSDYLYSHKKYTHKLPKGSYMY